jgi:Ni/Fe-hydrogenase subunit HybB-like protein
MLGGWQIENIDYWTVLSGPPLTDSGAGLQAVFPALVYVPSFLELGVSLGVLALGVALVLIGLRLLPLAPSK